MMKVGPFYHDNKQGPFAMMKAGPFYNDNKQSSLQ